MRAMEKEYECEAFDSKSDFPTELQGVSFVECTFVRCNFLGEVV